jgi:MftR C-terminal domain
LIPQASCSVVSGDFERSGVSKRGSRSSLSSAGEGPRPEPYGRGRARDHGSDRQPDPGCPDLGGLETLLTSDESLVAIVRKAISAIDDEHFAQARGLTMVRTKMIMETPTLRAAAGIRIAELTAQFADQLAVARDYPRTKARALVGALMGCVMAALYAWYESDGALSNSVCLDEALNALSELDRS